MYKDTILMWLFDDITMREVMPARHTFTRYKMLYGTSGVANASPWHPRYKRGRLGDLWIASQKDLRQWGPVGIHR